MTKCSWVAIVGGLMVSVGLGTGQDVRAQTVGGTQSPDARPEFEVASIKAPDPNGGRSGFGGGKRITADGSIFRARNADPRELVIFAYHLSNWQVRTTTGPVGRYNIEAKTPFPATEDQVRLMVQSLLADRFHLVSHLERKSTNGFALVSAGTLKLERASDDAETGIRAVYTDDPGVIMFQAKATTIGELAVWLSSTIAAPVLDQSSIQGRFNFVISVHTNPDPGTDPSSNVTSINMSASDYIAAVKKLGLGVKQQNVTVNILTIDHVEKPSLN